jgi:hypothetical protein
VDPALKRRKVLSALPLLVLDLADHSDNPFALFNQGWAYL